MKKLLVAAIVVLMASPAFAAIQNVKVSGDITSTFLDRQSFDLGFNSGTTAQGLKDQNIFLTQTRLRVDADLSDNVSTSVGLINERAWSGDNGETGYAADTNVELYLASVTMRELLYSPLSVTIGRQVFTYGNGLILGNGPNTTNNGGLKNIAEDMGMGTAEDGIKAVLDYKPLTIDLIYFKNDQKNIAGSFVQKTNDSSEVFGYNASYQLSDPWSTVVEQYMFSRVDEAGYLDNQTTGVGTTKGDQLYVPGLHASTNPVKGLNVQGEIAWELGNNVVTNDSSLESERREAMAAQVMVSYSLPVLEKYKPSVNASYTYLSGDKNSAENYNSNAIKSAKIYSAWDPMFDGQGSGTIYETLFPMTNMNILTLGAQANPLEDVTTSFKWSDLIAADSYTGAAGQNPFVMYQPNGTLGTAATSPATSDKRGLGNEYDMNVNYAYTEDVSFGISLGWFVPGDTFTKATRDTASQAIADVAVKF